MLTKTIENLKQIALKNLNTEALLHEVKSRSESISKLTLAERERLLDKVVGKILQGQDLGDNADAIRSKVKTRLFEKQSGDALFLNNLKYINEVLTGRLPRSLSDLSGFRDTLAAKLVEDAQGGTLPHHGHGGQRRDASGRNPQGPRGDFDRGRRGDRRPNRSGERNTERHSEPREGQGQASTGSHRGGAQHRDANSNANPNPNGNGNANAQTRHPSSQHTKPRHDEHKSRAAAPVESAPQPVVENTARDSETTPE